MSVKSSWLALLVPVTLLASVMGGLVPLPALTETANDYRQQGLLYRDQGQFPEAIAALKTAVALDPASLGSRVMLGWTQHLAGERQAATETLVQALYKNPFHVQTFNALGIVLLVDGDLDHAIAVHSWALILKPQNEIAYYNLSLAYQRQQKYDWAIATAKRAAELEPSNPHPLVAQAIAHWQAGERSQAQQAYQQALALDERYRQSAFLDHLLQAGFSPAQLQTTQQILASL